LAHYGLWDRAQSELERYLWLRPGDDRAHLKLAEVLVKNETLPSEDAIGRALDHLRRIPDESPLGPAARLQEGRLQFFVLHRPGHAERLFRHAIQLAPEPLEAHQLLWNVTRMTNRWDYAEPTFWKVYELTPEAQRAPRLRDWYMSQFFPITWNEDLDRLMGLLPPSEPASAASESRRFFQCRDAEPKEPVVHAALARWVQQRGDPETALKVLDEAAAAIDNAVTDPFFLAVLLATLVDLGDIDRADACFQKWPPPHEGHHYWKWHAVIADEVHGDLHKALTAYNRALELWPGSLDWRLRNKRANCLARLGKKQLAEEDRSRAKAIEKLMDDEIHERLRLILGELDKPEHLHEVADFYQKLGREREAECWKREASRLSAGAANQKPPVTNN